MPPFKAPFKARVNDFQKAAEEGDWKSIANMIARNFDEAELAAAATQTQFETVDTDSTALEGRVEAVEDAVIYLGSKQVRTGNGTSASSSVTFVDFPTAAPLNASFTKLQDSTRILIHVHFSAYASAVGLATVGITFGGTDYVIRPCFYNAINDHRDYSGVLELTGLPAGSYAWVMRARKDTGGGTLQTDANDEQTIIIEEVAA